MEGGGLNLAERERMASAAEIRNWDQNKKMWAMLRDISKQVKWPVNGKEGYLADDDWKDVFSAELRKEQRIAQGLSGGFVLLGLHTSRLKVREMADLIEIMYAFGAEHQVIWTEPTQSTGSPCRR